MKGPESAMKHTISVFFVAACAIGCGESVPGNSADAVNNYSAVVLASYQSSRSAVVELDVALTTLVDTPSEANLTAAREAWLAARIPYLQTEVYRFYDGPIDGDGGDPEGLINAWPMDEQTVDYVDGMPSAGRINDNSFAITPQNLVDANGEGGDADVATGWHPIEFLLWGQDLTAPDARMPGQRPATDFDTEPSADRRGSYLITLIDLLVEHMDELIAEWESSGAYRTEFEAAEPQEGLRRILTGMIVLSGFETAGERLQAALDRGDQEEEHSCFSDNTHNDMLYNVIGVRNVWRGEFGTTSGVGIRAVVEELDSDLATRLDDRINESVRLAEALQPPFDLEIQPGNTEGNARVQALIDSLLAQEDLLEEVFLELDLSIPVTE